MKVKKVFKFATGQIIPEGAIYLSTITQTEILKPGEQVDIYIPCWLVWHYFLVEVEANYSEVVELRKQKK